MLQSEKLATMTTKFNVSLFSIPSHRFNANVIMMPVKQCESLTSPKSLFGSFNGMGLSVPAIFSFLGRSFNWAQGFHENTINSLEICECMWKTTAIHKNIHKCAHRIYGGKSTPTEMIRWKSGISWFNSHPLYRHFAKHRPPYSSTPLLCRRLNGFPQYYNIKLMY